MYEKKTHPIWICLFVEKLGLLNWAELLPKDIILWHTHLFKSRQLHCNYITLWEVYCIPQLHVAIKDKMFAIIPELCNPLSDR